MVAEANRTDNARSPASHSIRLKNKSKRIRKARVIMWDTTGLEEDCTTGPEEKDVCVCIEDLNSCVSMSPSVALRGPRFHLPKPHGTASASVITNNIV